MSEYQQGIYEEAANDLYKALKIIREIDGNLAFTDMYFSHRVIQGSYDILMSVAEDLYQRSKNEVES